MKFGLKMQAAFMNGVIKFLKWMDLCVDQTGRDNPGMELILVTKLT